MKKVFYKLVLLGVLLCGGGCSDELDTDPTDKVSSLIIFKDANGAETAINGIYRLLYTKGWSNKWYPENCGLPSVTLMADLMGEDHLMYAKGFGWYYEDYRLNVRQDYINKDGRPYALWNFFYTIISNTNYIIDRDGKIGGDRQLAQSVVGQAYAMRALSYFYLIQLYQQTYRGNENSPGVPLYTAPTTTQSKGTSRGTVDKVYQLINEDIETAIIKLKDCGISQKRKSHIDYYAANGIKARICLVQGRYKEASEAALEALVKPGIERVAVISEIKGFNSVKTKNVLWGVEINESQASLTHSFFGFMDAGNSLNARPAQHCISSWLYGKIPETDERKSWWNGINENEEAVGEEVSFCQLKFKFADSKSMTGDYIFLRSEEMLLIAAEAECHQKHFTRAKELLFELGSIRDSDYEKRLQLLTESELYNDNTIASPVTLMDEILFQRRIELWGEYGRIFDLQRLKLGYNRKYDRSNHTEVLTNMDTRVASKNFIMTIPQSEIDGNEEISSKDQNPF